MLNKQGGNYLGKYKLTKSIGKGRFGKVIIAERNDGVKVAIKLIPLTKIFTQNDPNNPNPIKIYVEGQQNCMKKLNSPYLVKLLDIVRDQNNMHLIFQYCNGGNLRDVVKNKQFTMQEAKEYISHMIIGLQVLHKQNYLHQNIKPQNILFHTDSNNKTILKISDFGFSIQDKYQNQAQNYAFMAPELFLFHEYDYSVDIWAVGVAFYYILNRKFPFKSDKSIVFKGLESSQMMQKCQKYDSNMRFKNDVNLIEFFESIFLYEPTQRMDFNKIKSHEIFKEYFQDEQMLMQSQNIYYTKFIMTSQNFLKFKPDMKQKEVQSPTKIKKKKFDNEKNILIWEINKINFFRDSVKFLKIAPKFSQFYPRASILILKNYLIQLTKLQSKINNKQKTSQIEGIKEQISAQFFESDQGKEIRSIVAKLIQQGNTLYQYLDKTKQLIILELQNPGLNEILLKALPLNLSYSFKFFTIYRKILQGIENSLMENINKNSYLAYPLLKLIFRIVICRQFNKFFYQKSIQNSLKHYFNWNTKVYGQPIQIGANFDFNGFEKWLDNQDLQKIKQTLVLISDKFKKICF